MNKKLLFLCLILLVGFQACKNKSSQTTENDADAVVKLVSPDNLGELVNLLHNEAKVI